MIHDSTLDGIEIEIEIPSNQKLHLPSKSYKVVYESIVLLLSDDFFIGFALLPVGGPGSLVSIWLAVM